VPTRPNQHLFSQVGPVLPVTGGLYPGEPVRCTSPERVCWLFLVGSPWPRFRPTGGSRHATFAFHDRSAVRDRRGWSDGSRVVVSPGPTLSCSGGRALAVEATRDGDGKDRGAAPCGRTAGRGRG